MAWNGFRYMVYLYCMTGRDTVFIPCPYSIHTLYIHYLFNMYLIYTVWTRYGHGMDTVWMVLEMMGSEGIAVWARENCYCSGSKLI